MPTDNNDKITDYEPDATLVDIPEDGEVPMHGGEIANELREIHNLLQPSGHGSREARIKKARSKIADLTHQMEIRAWDESRPMDHVPSGDDIPDSGSGANAE